MRLFMLMMMALIFVEKVAHAEDDIDAVIQNILKGRHQAAQAEQELTRSIARSIQIKDFAKLLWLHVNQRRICRGLEETYDYEAFVDDDRDGHGNRINVDRIELSFWRPLGPIGGRTIGCDNTSWCPFTDTQYYGPGNGCTRSVAHACAFSKGSKWCTGDSVLN
jgi:hypothetical protein